MERAPLLQVEMAIGGHKVPVESDVYDVVQRLQEISPRLHVNYIDLGDRHHFTIVEDCDDGVERIVTTVQELTPDIVDRVG